ncbi:hypothetical protein D3C85_1558590 [compost metagenome]
MEFGDRGVAGLEHFDVQLTGDDLQLFRADLADQAIHQLAPGPEAVVRVAGHFREPGHGALEGVRVQVGHAWQQRTGQAFGVFGRGVGLDAGQQAVSADLDSDVFGPACRQQSTFGKEDGHRHGTSIVIICIYIYRRLPAG